MSSFVKAVQAGGFACLDRVLGPTLWPGNVVVLDDLPAHQVAGLAELLAARGVRLLHLPPYSPDFNPLELAFGKLKTWLRSAQARTRDAIGSGYPGRHRMDNWIRREKMV